MTALLLPIAGLFSLIVWMRRRLYRRGVLRTFHVGVPVVVVGNITAGGSGKTPLTIWLVSHLQARGLRPGVVSRGYAGAVQGCAEVRADSAATEVGDEPLLIHVKTGAPVVVGRDRVAAARMLLARHPGVDVVVSDDGLQHYRLHRTLEIAVLDAATGLGNGWPLPAGPLREPPGRLHSVDVVVQSVRGDVQPRALAGLASWPVAFSAGRVWRLANPAETRSLSDLPPRDWLAIAGIGQPQGYFDMLTRAGLHFTPRVYADHHAYRLEELPADRAVLMTEKDAVKCQGFAAPDWWVLALDATPHADFVAWLDKRLALL